MRFSSLLLLSLSLSPLAKAADQKLATVEISVDDKVVKNAAGLRTLFVIVYDSESRMPMPYGALKVELKADAKGSIYKGELTTANIQRMNEQAPVPKSIRLKARLDKDGSAGMDQPGDVVGKLDAIKVGDSAKIMINTPI